MRPTFLSESHKTHKLGNLNAFYKKMKKPVELKCRKTPSFDTALYLMTVKTSVGLLICNFGK